MRVLLDECIDERLRLSFADCQTARFAGLSGLKNGEAGSLTFTRHAEVALVYKKAIFLVITLALGLAIFEGVPALGVRWMDHHAGMWILLAFVYPLMILPLVCCVVEVADRPKRTRRFALIVGMAILMPESLIIVFQEHNDFAPTGLWSIWDAMMVLSVFFAPAYFASVIAPSTLRRLARNKCSRRRAQRAV